MMGMKMCCHTSGYSICWHACTADVTSVRLFDVNCKHSSYKALSFNDCTQTSMRRSNSRLAKSWMMFCGLRAWTSAARHTLWEEVGRPLVSGSVKRKV